MVVSGRSLKHAPCRSSCLEIARGFALWAGWRLQIARRPDTCSCKLQGPCGAWEESLPLRRGGSIEQFSSGMRASQPNRRCIALLLVVGGASAAQEQAMHHHGNAM